MWKRTNAHRVIAAASAVVSALVGLFTNVVFGVQGTGLAVVIAVLTAMTTSAAVLAWHGADAAPKQGESEAPPTPESRSRYGAVQLTGDKASFIAQSVSAVASAPYRLSLLSGTEIREPVNLVSERGQLRDALESEQPSVIFVHGRPGVGKTTLVNWVLLETGLIDRARRRNLAPGEPIDAKALLDEIILSPVLRNDEDVLGRLEVAMEAPDGEPCIIVVDGAQILLDVQTHSIVNLELAEALRVIALGRRPRVKVVLVLRDPPAREARSEWLARANYVHVHGLALEPFNSFLTSLETNPAGTFGLAALIEDEPRALHDVLQGNPGLANYLYAVLALSQGEWSARGLVRSLAGKSADQAERLLARRLVATLTSEQRGVVVALAAYGTSVGLKQVSALLAGELSEGQLLTLLPVLVSSRVIATTNSGNYYLPNPEIAKALARLDDGPARLRLKAANQLAKSRVSKEKIHGIEDLHVHFAELEIRTTARLWGSSYELINTMDEFLERWNAEVLLFKYRRAIAGNLRNDFREMVNYNELGNIYRSRGRFDDARHAFELALRHNEAADRPRERLAIEINLAALRWDCGDTQNAERHYRAALTASEEHDSALDRMAALAGLADCHRRRGEYPEAVQHGMSALSAAQFENSSWAVGIAVKLARWRSELGQPEEADRLLGLAEQAAAEHPRDPVLHVRCHDARADLLLDAGDLVAARKVAQQAVAKALQLQDPVTVMQASSTMAMVHLNLNENAEAGREIERAARYRREGRALLVLALQALIAFRADRAGTEAAERFAQLEREAIGRRGRDERDFAAWDFEGLALCGLEVVHHGQSFDAAITAFQCARRRASVTPVLDSRLRTWLAILLAEAAPGRLNRVLDAVTGAGTYLE